MTSVSVSALTTVLAPAAKTSSANEPADKSASPGTSSFSATLHRVEKASGTKHAETAKPADKSKDSSTAKVDQAGDPKATQSSDEAASPTPSSQPEKPSDPVAPVIDDAVKPNVSTKPATDVSDQPLVGVDVDKDKPVAEDASAQVVPSAEQPAALPLPDTTQTGLNNAMAAQAQQAPAQPDDTPIEQTPLASSVMASITLGKSLEKAAATPGTAVLKDAQDAGKAFPGVIENPQSNNAAPSTLAKAETPTHASVEPAAVAADTAVKLQTEPEKALNAQLPADDKDGSIVTSAVAATATTPAQPSSISSSANTSPVLQTPVTNQDWAKHLGQQLVNFHLKGDQDVQLHLNPANLGPMSITLNVNEHLQATAHFSSHSSQVRSALEQGINQLRESMAEQGISLGETSVGEQRKQGFAQDNGGKSQGLSTADAGNSKIIAEVTAPISSARMPANGEISTYA